MSTEKTSIEPHEAERRIEELAELIELGYRYARVDRATLMPDGKPETDGEHVISLAIAGTAYAMKYRPELDPYKVFFKLVMHDIDEHLHGDTPTLGATAETFRQKDLEEAEGAAARREILAAFPEFSKMVEDIFDLSVPENAFGKGFDKLGPGYTHESNNGAILKERYGLTSLEDLLESAKPTDIKMEEYAAVFADILEMRQAMHRKVARASFRRPFWVDEPLFEL